MGNPWGGLVVAWTDQAYKYDLFNKPGEIQCEEIPNVDEKCVNSKIRRIGGDLGVILPGNTCQEAVAVVVSQCRTGVTQNTGGLLTGLKWILDMIYSSAY
jgi:hypothetical protein